MLRCGAWPNLGYRLDKPWVRPYTANYKSDSRVIFVISISLTRFRSTEFGTVSCQAHCRSSTSSSTLSCTRFAPGPPIKLEVNALKFWQLTYVHCVASDSCHSGFCACSFQPFCENLIFMRSNLISYYLPCLTLCPCHSELELGNDERACMPMIQPVICIGLCVSSVLCWHYCTQSKRRCLRLTITARDWLRIGTIT